MNIHKITWQETIAVRHKVLWPDKAPEFCHVDGDEDALHYGAYVDESLVCVASIYTAGESARLRKFATLQGFQGRGIGTKVIQTILLELREMKCTEFWCDARESAVGFYQRFGLQAFGERFYKGDVAYFKMRVQLEK